jgi:hypothetical protein
MFYRSGCELHNTTWRFMGYLKSHYFHSIITRRTCTYADKMGHGDMVGSQ